jgi:hypothetical protein
VTEPFEIFSRVNNVWIVRNLVNVDVDVRRGVAPCSAHGSLDGSTSGIWGGGWNFSARACLQSTLHQVPVMGDATVGPALSHNAMPCRANLYHRVFSYAMRQNPW